MFVFARKFAAVAGVVAGVTLYPLGGLAIDLGLTPGQVYTIWTGINECLLVMARVISDDAAWHRELAGITKQPVQNKRPADVLRQLDAYRIKLDRLRGAAGLGPVRRFTGDGSPVTPTVVYLNSGQVLNGQAEWLIRHTGPEQPITGFYPDHQSAEPGDKTPSDVYGLVALANRRMALILVKAGIPDSGPPSGTVTP